MFAASLVLWYGGHEILLQRALEPQQFFIFLFAMLQLMSPLKSLSNVNATIQEGLAAAVRIFRLLDTKPTVVSRPGARVAQGVHEGIEFDHVSFRYGAGGDVLSDVTFTVRGRGGGTGGSERGGEVDAGRPGRPLLRPDPGSIRLDGRLRDYDVASHRRMMGVVTQESILFNDSVWNKSPTASRMPMRRRSGAPRAANAESSSSTCRTAIRPIGDRGVLLLRWRAPAHRHRAGHLQESAAPPRRGHLEPRLAVGASCRRRWTRSLRGAPPS